MRPLTAGAIAAAAAALVGVPAGCGDDRSPREKLAAAADRRCAEFKEGNDPLLSADAIPVRELAARAGRMAPRLEALTAELRDLDAPADARQDVAEYIQIQADSVGLLRRMAQTSRTGAMEDHLGTSATLDQQASSVATELGWDECRELQVYGSTTPPP